MVFSVAWIYVKGEGWGVLVPVTTQVVLLEGYTYCIYGKTSGQLYDGTYSFLRRSLRMCLVAAKFNLYVCVWVTEKNCKYHHTLGHSSYRIYNTYNPPKTQPGFLQGPGHPLPLDIGPSNGKHHLRYSQTSCPTIDLRSTSSIHHCYDILWTYGPGMIPAGHGVQHVTEYTANIKIAIPCQHSGEKKLCCVLFSCSEHNYYTTHIALPKGGYDSLNTNPTHSICYYFDLS
jgi:hypothetical protein